MDDIKKLNDKVFSLEKRVTALEAHIVNNATQPIASGDKKISVREFIISKNPSNDVQKALTIGYYLEKYEGLTSFNVEDIGRCFQLAKESTPDNINDKVNINIRKGHIAEAREKKDSKKAWIVTNSGEKFVDGGFKETKK